LEYSNYEDITIIVRGKDEEISIPYDEIDFICGEDFTPILLENRYYDELPEKYEYCEVTGHGNSQTVTFKEWNSSGEIVNFPDYQNKPKFKIEHSDFLDFTENDEPIKVVLWCWSNNNKIVIRDKEAGNIICEVDSYEEGNKLLKKYVEEDKRDGNYVPDFYEIAEILE
jgi:hypothetical protein